MGQGDARSALVTAGHNPWLAVAAIVGASLVHEDLATIGVGIAVAEGLVEAYIGLPAILFGVMMGDWGLYALGRLGAYSRRLARFIDPDRMAAAKRRLGDRLLLGVFVIRFLPGLRLSGYLACGFFHVPFPRFAVNVLLAVGVWTTGLYFLAFSFGALTERVLGYWQWPAIGLAFVVPVILAHGLRRRKPADPPGQ